jgi:DNA-binding beta-propeller fold protein YncE
MTAAYGSLWILDASADLLTRVDPATRSITAEIPAGRSPYAVMAAAGSLWVTNTASGNVTRIDRRTVRRTGTFHVGGYPYGITGDTKSIWVARLGGHPVVCIDIATRRIRALKGATTDSIDLTLRQHTLWAITSGAILRLPTVCGRDS